MGLGKCFWFLIAAKVLLVCSLFEASSYAQPPSQIALPGCQEKCGNVSIPYPFGIGDRCSHETFFEITCNTTFDTPTPVLGHNLNILDIDLLNGHIRLAIGVARDCYYPSGQKNLEMSNGHWVSTNNLITVNATQNVFAAIGCDTYAWIAGTRNGLNYSTGCMTQCWSPQEVGTCSGNGCCQSTIPEGTTYDHITLGSFFNYTTTTNVSRCSSAFFMAKDSFNTSLTNMTMRLQDDETPPQLPVVYDWTIGYYDCSTAQANGSCLCKGKSQCFDSSLGPGYGYRCSCLDGYSGNPYLPDGCQDIDECATACEHPSLCINTEGSFQCKCPKGFHGNGTKDDRCVANKEFFSTAVKVTTGVGGGIIVLMVVVFWFCWRHEKERLMTERKSFFRQNGGQILLQQISRLDASFDMFEVFTIEDLKNASDNFSEKIGEGGFGMVYKGVLPNKQVVAIKKSLKVDSSQSEQFINEVIVLYRLNNRHVVKLVGCCLETETPLLVYEFIDNGTLYEHLHDEGRASLLAWDIRLRIVSEVAGVLSFLHTEVYISIIHRDVKSMNILLDKGYSAKVSDFGASRLVPIDQDQMATMVLGTRGYLDPEYFQTGELTHKSDVYSFGVVLVEILTREKALSTNKPESDKNLAIFFLRKLKEDRLFEILDKNIVKEGAMEQLNQVADLARRCLKLKGEDRPTMKEVAMELERIRATKGSHPWSSAINIIPSEENEYLLAETTQVDHNIDGFRGGNTTDASNSQSMVLQLVSLNDGR